MWDGSREDTDAGSWQCIVTLCALPASATDRSQELPEERTKSLTWAMKTPSALNFAFSHLDHENIHIGWV